ncbi:MAG: F0F1 ATP synthase subunit gamma [Candidatus Omnitrophica bacterium]|nr:F0F1 ATP synthase subunit gamma [Candidatus Omnitrophota bacterium]
MGKANKVKREFRDAREMVELIQTLKDIADNKFFTLMGQKAKFRRFGETFVDFFRLISFTKAKHPLIGNDNPKTAMVVITAEGSFLGEFNTKVIRRAVEEAENLGGVEYISVGEKGIDRLKQYTPNLKAFPGYENIGLYESAVEIKNYLVDGVMKGQFGKVMVCYSFPKSFDIQKARIVKLLPADELITKQAQFADLADKRVIEESDPGQLIGFLVNLWVTTRLYEILVDTIIAASAAQAKFLDDSVDKMKKERDKVKVKFRKARKGDIDKSLRETFSARMMVHS